MPSVRTKRGRCHVDSDAIRLESSLRGQLRRYREGNRFLFACYVVALLALAGFAVSAVLGVLSTRTLLVVAGAVVLLAGARGVSYVRGFTSDDEIPIADVTRVTGTRGTRGLTRPRFVVHYERDGTEKKRYVMMPSRWLSYGDDAFERAVAAFESRGLDVTVDD